MPATTPPDATSAPPVSPQQIGHYQVLAKIGEGGMGVVYRARDPRLNREVAIKVFPRVFAEDPYRMARFEREAQLLASLNHPKIAAIYGLEESGSTRALVMELVEGPTLAERIGRAAVSARASNRPGAGSASPAQASGGAGSGAKTSARSGAKGGSGTTGGARKSAIPIDEALPIAQQVAEALEYAHEHGVVHRDLKPANIKVTPEGDVKVLDFGLAKAMGPADASGDMSNSPTLSLAMTEAGLIVGTAAYMAPEQAKGKPVDRRADVWAFGCVLYEMLTGQKAFEGETVSDVLAAVIKSEPDWAALPADTPFAIQRLVRRCLQKDVRQRLQAIGDARIAIEETLSDAEVARPESGLEVAERKRASLLRRAAPWALGAVAILFAASTAWFALRPGPRQNSVRFAVPEPENGKFIFGGMTSISPDGRTLAFVADPGPGKAGVLWLRPLDSLTAQPIPGTDGAVFPFWSSDSRQVGFFAHGKLEKVAVSGGPPQTLCDADGRGGTWSQDGEILFAKRDGIYRVPDSGGTPALVLTPDPAHEAAAYSFPQFLPDGRHFLVTVNTPGTNILGAGSLDSKTVEHLARINSQVYYAPPGYVIYQDQSTIMARRFSAKELRFEGPAVPIAQSVGSEGPNYGFFSVSSAGVLAYQSGTSNDQDEMTWFDRKGQKLGTVGPIGLYTDPRISPDGSRLAVVFRENMEISTYDVWVYDLKRNTGSRLTFASAQNDNPSWSHDGSRIYFSSSREGKNGIYEKPADGLGNAQLVFQSGQIEARLNDVSPDDRYAMYVNPSPVQSEWVLPLAGGGKPFAWAQGGFAQERGRFSPNGRYVAYVSWETGRPEVYVQTFPQHVGKWQISTAGGNEPEWRQDGKELFFIGANDEMMSVDVTTGTGSFQAGVPKVLFKQPVDMIGARNSYAVSSDGQRFLLLMAPSGAKPEPITVVLNWPALLKK